MNDTATSTRVRALLTKMVELERYIEQSDAEFGTFRLEEGYAKLREELSSISPELLAPALAFALSGPVSAERAKAAEMLGALKASGAAPALRSALSDADEVVRAEAVRALGSIGDKSGLSSLVARLSDASPRVRLAAVEALAELSATEAARSIEGLLQDPNPEVRKRAAGALAKLDPAGAPGAIARLSHDPVEGVRSAAAELLARFAGEPEGCERLAAWAVDPSGEVRRKIYEGFGAHLTRPIAERLLSPILQHPVAEIRIEAAVALARRGSQAQRSTLVELVYNSDKRIRRMAVEALGDIVEALDPLVHAIRDPEAILRSTAVDALEKVAARTGANVLDPLCEAAADPQAYVRRGALAALSRIVRPAPQAGAGEPSNAGVLEGARARGSGPDRVLAAVERGLGDSDERVVEAAINAAQALGDPSLAPALTALLVRPSFNKALDPLLAALDSLGDAGTSALASALAHPDPSYRERAAAVLHRPPGQKLIEPLIAALSDTSPAVRANAAFALGALGAKGAADALLGALDDHDPNVLARAAQALGKLGEGRAGPALAGLVEARLYLSSELTRDDYTILACALKALAGARPEGALDLLGTALCHDDFRVRRDAAGALGELGDKRAVGALTGALKDPSDQVRRLAEAALRQLRGGR